jgi:hypothetical protein
MRIVGRMAKLAGARRTAGRREQSGRLHDVVLDRDYGRVLRSISVLQSRRGGGATPRAREIRAQRRGSMTSGDLPQDELLSTAITSAATAQSRGRQPVPDDGRPLQHRDEACVTRQDHAHPARGSVPPDNPF